MAQLVVRNIEDDVKQRLQCRAKRHGCSLEEEVRDILRDAAKAETSPLGGLGSEIASAFADAGLDEDITELRGHTIEPLSFEP